MDRLAFLCLPANDPKAQELYQKWQRGEILDELRGRTPNWFYEVEIPTDCQRRDQQRERDSKRDGDALRNKVQGKDDVLLKQ
jgi:hypothetical protein